MSPSVLIIDYGFGNLFSLERAFQSLGTAPVISGKPEAIGAATHLVLPGVGAFGDGSTGLRRRGLEAPILAAVAAGKPLLGICLGMQFLFEKSYEFGEHKGLALFKGEVREVPLPKGDFCKIPHMGWNTLAAHDGRSFAGTILEGVGPQEQVYFVHSFAGYARENADILADTNYCGSIFPSVVSKGRLSGVQFHPEKSAGTGARILKNFLSM